jgi:hypothetical protein
VKALLLGLVGVVPIVVGSDELRVFLQDLLSLILSPMILIIKGIFLLWGHFVVAELCLFSLNLWDGLSYLLIFGRINCLIGPAT